MGKKSLEKQLYSLDGTDVMNRLVAIQEKNGFIPEKDLRELSGETGIPLARLYSAASFYSFLKLEKTGKHFIHVCNSPSCYLNGSTSTLESVEKVTGLKPGESNDKFCFETASCIGCCDEAPAMLVDGKAYGNLTHKKIKEILKKCGH